MRIVAGECRGRRLHAPKGEKIRPTTDRVREAIFSIIASKVPGAVVADLFAGTGALGLEAVSRGAMEAFFVDLDLAAVRLIHSNVKLCGVEGRCRVIQGPVQRTVRQLSRAGRAFDLIFMDPPYWRGEVEKTLPCLDGIAKASTLVVAEHHVKEVLPLACGTWLRLEQRSYGDTAITFYVNGSASVNSEDGEREH